MCLRADHGQFDAAYQAVSGSDHKASQRSLAWGPVPAMAQDISSLFQVLGRGRN